MEKDVNKRINQILESTEGMQRAKPSMELLQEIENRIDKQEATIIPIERLRWAVAAAVLILFVNGLVINTYLNQRTQANEYAKQSLIMDYKLYK